MKKFRPVLALALAGILALVVAACGSSSNSGAGGSSTSSGTSTSSTTTSSAPKLPLKPGEDPTKESLSSAGVKHGGTLTVYSSEDFEHLDPGESYFSLDYAPVYATQRPLFIYMPNSQSQLSPDLATAIPTTSNGGVTDGGKTVTVHIEPNVHFSPPVNRVVTSADVKYAIERGANPNVGNGYFAAYFGDIVGAAKAKGGPISGIVTPNKTTIVFHLTKPTAALLIQALSLPLTAPVPESMAGPMDKKSPTTYGSTAVAETGPYMIKQNAKGDFIGIGYQTGKSLILVRNPNWSASTYAGPYKPPAFLNQINVDIGGDPDVIGPQVLKGSDSVQLDTPSKAAVKLAYTQYPSQITFTQGAGDHYMALNNHKGPFTNVNLRRAVYANLDRDAIIKEKGGLLTGTPGTHFITPGTDGFEQAGGYPGPQYPWNKDTAGNLKVAEQYMKKAGYPSGKYTGNQTVTIVASNNGADELAINQIVQQDLTQLGFKTHLSQVDQSVMYSKYCGVPKEEIDVCPSGGWIRDFNDAFSILYVPFNGAAIVPTNNSNFGQVNNPIINRLMAKAESTVNPAAEAQAWANVDKEMVNLAVAVPEDFDIQPNIFAGDVHWVGDLWNVGSVDFAYTGLK